MPHFSCPFMYCRMQLLWVSLGCFENIQPIVQQFLCWGILCALFHITTDAIHFQKGNLLTNKDDKMFDGNMI